MTHVGQSDGGHARDPVQLEGPPEVTDLILFVALERVDVKGSLNDSQSHSIEDHDQHSEAEKPERVNLSLQTKGQHEDVADHHGDHSGLVGGLVVLLEGAGLLIDIVHI